MRWQALFDDIEAQWAELGRQEFESEVTDRTQREQSAVRLRQMLAAHSGAPVEARLGAAGMVSGELHGVGADWMLLGDGMREVLVVLAAVMSVRGLGPHAGAPASLSDRLGLGHALRGVMRDRGEVEAALVDGSRVTGLIDRVGADHVVIVPRAGRAGEETAVTFGGLACVLRRL